MTMRQIPYEYHNLPIPGGGYVTGFLYSPQEADVLYCRTDIGGTYRFDYANQKWVSLIPHVTMRDLSETYPIALAIDENQKGSLYIACGLRHSPTGVLAISEDYGESFRYETIPAMVHGNLPGRGTDERLIVDQGILYYASQREGLFRSDDRGKSWRKLDALQEQYLSFVKKVGRALVVAIAGVTTRSDESMRGHSLYLSYDGGESFAKMPEPKNRRIEGCRLNGLVAQRCCMNEKYLYITFAATGRRALTLEEGYSCDAKDIVDGRIARYPLLPDGSIGDMEEITPCSVAPTVGVNLPWTGLQENSSMTENASSESEGICHCASKEKSLEFGFSGISTSAQTPGMLVATTIRKEDGDSIFLSTDYGTGWKQILYDLAEGEIRFRTPYMKPEYNGGHSLIHWLSDIKINPFCDDEAWFNTGTGVFRTQNLKDSICSTQNLKNSVSSAQNPKDSVSNTQNLKDSVCRFTDWCDGLEETVHLNVYSLPKGKVQVIDIVGDLGGFAFEDLDTPCENSFADEHGNRYITCINADFPDENPNRLIVTPRGNWTGATKGGLILSNDQGKTFERLPMPYGLTEEIDQALHRIEEPNINSGWVAMSPDGQKIVWCIARFIWLPVQQIVVSADGGRTFTRSKFFLLDSISNHTNNTQAAACGEQEATDNIGEAAGSVQEAADIEQGAVSIARKVTGGAWQAEYSVRKTEGNVKVFSDRTDSDLFYGFGGESDFYISHDGGRNFYQYELPPEFPKVDFGLIDCANRTEIRGEAGRSGVFYLAIGEGGLWKLEYDKKQDRVQCRRLTKPGDTVYRVGLGIGSPDGDYFRDPKAIYCNAIINGGYGFYRSLDDCRTFERINTDQQMFGDINSIDGDCRVFGQFYLATGTNGVKYGRMIE